MQKVATLLSGSRFTFALNVTGCDHTTGSEQGSELAGETKGVVSSGQNGHCVSPSALCPQYLLRASLSGCYRSLVQLDRIGKC